MFISRIKAAGEDRSPFGDFWFEPVTLRTASGSRVSPDTAMQLSAVFRAVVLISGHFAMLPMRLRKAGTLGQVATHPLLKLFKKPNAWQNGYEWRQMMQGHLLLRGNAYNEIVEDRRGNILALLPLHPDRTRIELLENGDYRYRVTDQNGNERILPRGQVFHLRGLSSNGITGLSVIECARESMGLGLSAQNYGARFFANDGRPTSGWIEFPGKFADKAARMLFRESVQEAQAAANRGKMMVLDQGMKYHEVGVTNSDAQFLESRKFQIAEIARWFGVPPHKLADLDRATFSNIEQQAMEYITDSLLIWTEIWEAAIEDVLLLDDEGLEVDFDFRRLERGDSSTRASFANTAIMAGYLTRNEARAIEGLEPLQGLDEPLRPLNMVEESAAEDLEADQEAAEPPAQEAQEPKEPGESAKRLQALLESNADRVARRVIKNAPLGESDIRMIAEAMAVSHEAADRWVKTTPWVKETFTVENVAASLISLASK